VIGNGLGYILPQNKLSPENFMPPFSGFSFIF